jgi:hypothetical protein
MFKWENILMLKVALCKFLYIMYVGRYSNFTLMNVIEPMRKLGLG